MKMLAKVKTAWAMAFVILQVQSVCTVANAAAVQLPKAGDIVLCRGAFSLDVSNLEDGYMLVSYSGTGQYGLVELTKDGEDKKVYDYKVYNDGRRSIVPFFDGDGGYTLRAWERGNRFGLVTYDYITEEHMQVQLSDPLLPYLYPSLYCDYTSESDAVAKGGEITAGLATDVEKINAVYNFLTKNIAYDYEKLEAQPGSYNPDPDIVLQSRKGICSDYVVLAAAMLRSQGIPTKMVFGTMSSGRGHAWISVYSQEEGVVDGIFPLKKNAWTPLDPTFAANGATIPLLLSEYTDDYRVDYEL